MIRNTLAAVLLTSAAASAQFQPIQHSDRYHAEVDVVDMTDDEVSVTVVPPVQNESVATFAMPKIIPGTYDISDFGRFIKNFHAYDSYGNELEVEHVDVNRWEIQNAKSLYRITYDAIDTQEEYDKGIFLPGGTAISDSACMMNLFGFVGFMEGQDKMPFELEVKKFPGLNATTALDIIDQQDKRDKFYAQDYFELHDRPILYSTQANASVMVAGAEVMVGTYSPSGALVSQDILDEIMPVFTATRDYLGGTLPTDRYVVLVWGKQLAEFARDGSAGALEHFTSTTLVWPDMRGQEEGIRHVTAHEFFHIITPLNIHSEHIHSYDFMNPQMSKHLWFYEGVTEYNSLIAQVRGGIMSEAEFMNEMLGKMNAADNYDEHIPMTLRSEHALDIFADQYGDVYQKGALIGMALDMHLRVETNGEEGLVDLLIKLKDMYGPDTFFVDNNFFDIIIDHTPEGTEEFLYNYIAGTHPLPFEELFDQMGYSYQMSVNDYEIRRPAWSTSFISSRSRYYFVSRVDNSDPFTEAFGLKQGDYIVEWNGERVRQGELTEVMDEWAASASIGDEVTIEIKREDAEGDLETLKLTSTVTLNVNEERHILKKDENPSAQENQLLSSWLNLGE